MELHQLRYFVTVVDEASFTRAAEVLFVTQPGVSAQVRRLEKEVGQPLLHRSRSGVTPTAAGRELLPHARAALAAVAHGRQAVDAVIGLTRGTVHLGVVPGLAPEPLDLATVLAGFHGRYPDIGVRITEAAATKLEDLVREGRADAAFLATGTTVPHGMRCHSVIREGIVAVTGGDAGPASPGKAALADIAEHDLLLLGPQSGVRKVLDDAFRAHDLHPRIRCEAGDPRFLVSLAAQGLGTALVPESYAAGIPHVRISPAVTGVVVLAFSADVPLSPAAAALVRWAVEHLPDATTPDSPAG